ncbi:Hypothetical predicted protein, partial [Olea europaea subsp. europaea]
MNSRGPKTLEGTTNFVEKVASNFLPKCTQIEAMVTTIFAQNSTELTLPLSSEHKKTPRENLTSTKNDEIALGNVPIGIHIEIAKTSSFRHHLASRTTPKAPEHGKTLGATVLAPDPSHAECVTNTRLTWRATTTTTTAYSYPKSYTATVSNVSVVSQVDRSQKKPFAQVLRALQESMDH